MFTYGFRGLLSHFYTCSWRRNLGGGIALDGYGGGGGGSEKHILKYQVDVDLCVFLKSFRWKLDLYIREFSII